MALAHLFVKVLDQKTVKAPFQSSRQAATCLTIQKVHGAIPLTALPKDTTSELAVDGVFSMTQLL